MRTLGLYIHVPFCKKKCNYCDFTSYAGKEHMMEDYVNALLIEMSLWSRRISDYSMKTIFIGGGTPTFLHGDLISRLMDGCQNYFVIDRDAEVTIEGNPGTLSLDKLKQWKKDGINRISMGLQAYQADLLQRLGRIHSYDDFVKSISYARRSGFTNINVDLMFGLPDQTYDQWMETIDRVSTFSPEHISCYGLKIEENTPFYREFQSSSLSLPDDEMERKMYWGAVKRLHEKGMEQYEISNFALPGYECRHNIQYWTNNEYIGIGCAAHSYLDKARMANEKDLTSYISKINKGENISETLYRANRKDEIFDTIMLGLRLTRGIHDVEFKRRFGISLNDLYSREISALCAKGLLKKQDGFVKLTARGMDVQNQVLLEFLKDD